MWNTKLFSPNYLIIKFSVECKFEINDGDFSDNW